MKAKFHLVSIAAVSLLATTAAVAQTRILSSNGVWQTFHAQATNGPMCGMMTLFNDRSRVGHSIMVKYQQSNDQTFIQLYKDSWRWPDNDVDINITISFDTVRLNANAKAYSKKQPNGRRQGYVEVLVETDFIPDFLDLFSSSKIMSVEFADGNEPNWWRVMDGSRPSAKVFTECVVRLGNGEVSTRPFGSAPKSGTTPFGKGKLAPSPAPAPVVRPRPDDRAA